MEVNDEFIKRIEAAFKRITLTFQRLAELGWTVPMWAAPVETVEILEACDKSTIDEAFIELYTSDNAKWLGELTQDLLSYEELNKWQPLIKECFNAYHREAYLITIPALLSVIDGVIADSQSDDIL